MDLRRSAASARPLLTGLFATLVVALAMGCERDDKIPLDRNLPPETYVTQGPVNSDDPRDPTDLFYRSHLYWRGEDRDGTVAGFRFAIDDTSDPGAWRFTMKTDSVFLFPVADVGSEEHLFLIRSVDNLGKQDPSPDTLRFESFTRNRPVVEYVPNKFRLNDQPTTLVPGDTVGVFSSILYAWTGSDEDGEIVSWESKFDNELGWTFHERSDTTREERDLRAGAHTMSVRATDDAGAKSTRVARFTTQANFDPITVVDRTSIVSTGRKVAFGIPPETTAVYVRYSDVPGTAGDTLLGTRFPSGGSLDFCWSSTDVDGPVVDFTWTVGSNSDVTTDTCASTQLVLTDGGAPNGLPVLVKGRDVYGQLETPRDTVRIAINFPPTVEFDQEDAGDVPAGPLFRFPFSGTDMDGDENLIDFQWQFDFESSYGSETVFPSVAESLFVAEAFTISQVGPHWLRIRGIDDTGALSEPDTVIFNVVPPSSATPVESGEPSRR